MPTDGHAGTSAPGHEATHAREHREHLLHEAFTMALYVAICLLAALSVFDAATTLDRGQVVSLVWGTTIGLAVVHYFSFRVAGGMVTTDEAAERASLVAAAQLAGAAVVAGVVTVALLLTPTQSEVTVAVFVVAALIGVMGYLVARASAKGPLRAVLFAALILVLAVGVAAVKVRLSK